MSDIDNTRYRTPTSIEDAEVRMLRLEQDVKIISSQLFDQDKIDGFKQRPDYTEWRSKAMDARRFKSGEANFLRRWLELRDPDKGFKLNALRTMLAASVPILKRAGDAGLLSQDELAYVNHVGTLVSEPIMITGGYVAES